MEAILSRHSVRDFKGVEISSDTLEKLVHAGMSAPSAMHSSPWHFVVVTDRKRLDGVAEVHPYAAMSLQASAGILVCGEPDREALREFFDQNCAAAAENILIAACDLGLGAVWVGLYPNKTHIENFTKYFNLPKNIVPFTWIPIGYPKTSAKADNRFNPSKVHYNIW
ncbi:MAG: nitroreductase family protein [Puniceicoccales bacterium]|jgi:nitroreductase|nr:nitroreductase family protein [Puniceicoccales bacterium]